MSHNTMPELFHRVKHQNWCWQMLFILPQIRRRRQTQLCTIAVAYIRCNCIIEFCSSMWNCEYVGLRQLFGYLYLPIVVGSACGPERRCEGLCFEVEETSHRGKLSPARHAEPSRVEPIGSKGFCFWPEIYPFYKSSYADSYRKQL